MKCSTLMRIVDRKRYTSNTSSCDLVSFLQRVFEFGYRDHLERYNPAPALKVFRLAEKDRRLQDPFTI